MKNLFLFFFTFFTTSVLFAQNNVSGRIVAENKPIEFATVLVLEAKDSSLTKGAISDAEGSFLVEGIETGEYLLHISSVGYSDYYRAISIQETNTDLGTIALQTATIGLEAVKVTAQKPAFEVKADKTIMNVEGSVNAAGSNALELLSKAPGVMVDRDNNISMKGKSGVNVYIDGKPSNLSEKDLAALLQSMQASDIANIELITNPSAKYDAAGTAGIINIRLKKNKRVGFNGNTEHTVAQGITPKYSGSLGLNYRNKKWNLFGNGSYYRGITRNGTEFYREQNGYGFNQKGISDNNGQNAGLKAGMDYFINDKHTIGVVARGNFSKDIWTSDSRTPIGRVGEAPTEILVALANDPNNRKNLNFNANYRFADTTGRELTIDADYGVFSNTSQSNQPNFYKDITENTILVDRSFGINRQTDIHIKTFKIDYEMPLWKGKMGVGAKTAFVDTDNNFNYFDRANNTNTHNLERSNFFSYLENVNAAYLNFNRSFGTKWSVQTGLRVEQTRSNGTLHVFAPTDTTQTVRRSYTDFFPSAALTYTLSPKHSFNLTFSRRIERPNYQDLNPFEGKIDELTYERGNPFLNPQYTNSVELTHTFMGFINTSFNMSRTNGFAAPITDTVGQATYVQVRNLATVDNYGVNMAVPLMIPKVDWYSGFLNMSFNHQEYKANFGANKDIDIRNINTFGLYMENSFKFAKTWSTQVSGWFQSASIWGGTFFMKPMGSMDIGVQKKILKGMGNLKLSCSDVFFTQRWKGVSNFGGTYFVAKGYSESRRIRLSFSYRFGNQELKSSQRKMGNEEESNRIKSK